MSNYPEHDKVIAIKDRSQIIGEFLEFGEYVLCVRGQDDELYPVGSITDVLAKHFKIDQGKLEAEKREMLRVLREANEHP